MANTERPISFLKDDFKNPSSGVNPAASKNQSFMFPQSLLWTKKVSASDCSKRQQQLRAHHRAAVAVGIYKNRCYILFLSGGWGCRTTHGKSAPPLGNLGLSWVPRIVTGLPVYALPGVIPQLAVACCWFAWDAFALYIVFLIANGIGDR